MNWYLRLCGQKAPLRDWPERGLRLTSKSNEQAKLPNPPGIIRCKAVVSAPNQCGLVGRGSPTRAWRPSAANSVAGLLRAKGKEGVHPGGAPRGDEARRQRHRAEQRSQRRIDRRIARLDFIEQASQGLRRSQRGRDADCDTARRQYGRAAHVQADDTEQPPPGRAAPPPRVAAVAAAPVASGAGERPECRVAKAVQQAGEAVRRRVAGR